MAFAQITPSVKIPKGVHALLMLTPSLRTLAVPWHKLQKYKEKTEKRFQFAEHTTADTI